MIDLRQRLFFLFSLAALAVLTTARAADALSPDITQLVVSIAPDWEAPRGKLQCFERTADGWRAVGTVVPVAYGKHGLAWGRGRLGTDETGARKVEGDLRAPAGVFAIGQIFGYAAALPAGADPALPYHQITAADTWIEDPTLPDYNRHVIVDLKNPPTWYERERMKFNDPAFRWRIEIRHNADPPVPGAGSAIFLHIRRGQRVTAGCTTLPENELVTLIGWLRAKAQPHYVLLPWSEYERLATPWQLPAPDLVSPLATGAP